MDQRASGVQGEAPGGVRRYVAEAISGEAVSHLVQHDGRDEDRDEEECIQDSVVVQGHGWHRLPERVGARSGGNGRLAVDTVHRLGSVVEPGRTDLLATMCAPPISAVGDSL